MKVSNSATRTTANSHFDLYMAVLINCDIKLMAIPLFPAGILRKYYLPTSFLRLVSESELFAKLYQQMLLTLEPMLHLPFDLSIDFEAKQEEEARLRVARQQQEMSRVSMSPVPPKRTSSPEGSPQVRREASFLLAIA